MFSDTKVWRDQNHECSEPFTYLGYFHWQKQCNLTTDTVVGMCKCKKCGQLDFLRRSALTRRLNHQCKVRVASGDDRDWSKHVQVNYLASEGTWQRTQDLHISATLQRLDWQQLRRVFSAEGKPLIFRWCHQIQQCGTITTRKRQTEEAKSRKRLMLHSRNEGKNAFCQRFSSVNNKHDNTFAHLRLTRRRTSQNNMLKSTSHNGTRDWWQAISQITSSSMTRRQKIPGRIFSWSSRNQTDSSFLLENISEAFLISCEFSWFSLTDTRTTVFYSLSGRDVEVSGDLVYSERTVHSASVRRGVWILIPGKLEHEIGNCNQHK